MKKLLALSLLVFGLACSKPVVVAPPTPAMVAVPAGRQTTIVCPNCRQVLIVSVPETVCPPCTRLHVPGF